MTPKNHALFQKYPLNAKAALSTGEVPTPYHIYDGYGLFIGGTASLSAVQTLLKNESVAPVQTQAGEALMAIWVCNFTDASLGAHHELQFSVFVSPKPMEPVRTHPLQVLNLMLTNPTVQMMCHGLWNNTETVVAYNRELLGLNAKLAGSQINREPKSITFDFKDAASGAPVFGGAVSNPLGSSLKANLDMMGLAGFGPLMAVARNPWVSLNILNPVGEVINRNAVAESHTKNDVNNVKYFSSPADRLEFGDTPYARLGFKPQFFQYMDGFKFVYLNPK
jgi:hypothetical protein